MKAALIGSASIGLLHLLWVALVRGLAIQPIFLPGPGATYAALWELAGTSTSWSDTAASSFRVATAFLISGVIAYPIVLASLVVNALRVPIFWAVDFFRYLPIPVFVPLTILWFGVGDLGKIVIVCLGTFVQMIPMFYDSTMSVQGRHTAATGALKWGRVSQLRHVVIPGSAPYVLDDARICLGWAWTYLVVAELIGATHGLGYAIIRSQRYLATDLFETIEFKQGTIQLV